MRHPMRALAISAVVGAVAFGGALAGAHEDYNGDGNRNSARRCDTYYRPGHAKDAQGRPDKRANGSDNPDFDESTGHSEDHSSEFDQGEVGDTGVYVHNHTGHYVVRHDAFYVEVVGGGGYVRDGNNGGYVQGEVDAAEDAPDADFHANLFAGQNGAMHSEAACVSVADTKAGDEGEQP